MKCPNCGAENRDEVRFCRKCGQPLLQPSGADAGLAPRPVEISPNGRAETSQPLANPSPAVPEASASTEETSQPMGETSRPMAETSGIICPACGATAKIGARYCPRCGHAFQPSQPGETPSGSMGRAAAPKAAPDAAASDAGRTRVSMGPLEVSPEGYARPQQPVPPPPEAPPGQPLGPAYRGATPVPKRGAPRWLIWLAVAVLLLAILAGLGLLAWRILGGDPGPEAEPGVAATAEATATQEAQAAVPPATASPESEVTPMPEPTALAEAVPVVPTAGLVLELDISPDAPYVGDAVMLTAVLVNNGEDDVEIQDYEIVSDGAPQLQPHGRPPSEIFAFLGARGASTPALFLFTAEEAGDARVEVRVTFLGADGTAQELSALQALTVRE